VITACGQLQPDDPSLQDSQGESGDRYEDFPEDETGVDISKPEIALQVNRGHRLGWREANLDSEGGKGDPRSW
jgi:hypothetical protein